MRLLYQTDEYSADVARLCACGHKLGEHLGTTDPQENDDESYGRIGCDCQTFREPH